MLVDELGRVFPQGTHRELLPGWVASELTDQDESLPASVAFAGQCLPQALAVSPGSISAWAKCVTQWLLPQLGVYEAPWRLHVFSAGVAGGRRRCQLISDGVRLLLRQKQRRRLRSLVADDALPWVEEEVLVQVGLSSAGDGFLSLCPPPLRKTLCRSLSRFSGGEVHVPPDRSAPSRAFAKLAEVEQRLARPIAAGETCVDLGSSPGSWAWLALHRGARVTAVDRSPLRADLTAHPRLSFVQGDAFRYRPPQPVDWLLCDVIAYPDRILELIQSWLGPCWCRRFCVTVKFRGGGEYAKLEAIKAWLAARGAEFMVRRLTNNKNEVTVFGEVGGAAATPAT